MKSALSVQHNPNAALRLEAELRRLQQLAQLARGWDGADAHPLAPVAVAHAALMAYSVLTRHGDAPTFIAPIPDGGVQVEWESDDSALELAIGPDGYKESLLVLNRNSGTREVHEYGEPLESSERFERAARGYFEAAAAYHPH